MRIALVDFIPWDYTIDTPYERPLGGSQSALCYLADELAQRGHDVWLINNTPAPLVSRAVQCLPLAKATPDVWVRFDAAVLLNAVKQAAAIRPLLRSGARLVAWLQHADDQPAVRGLALPEFREAPDAFAFVSQWQRDQFIKRFGIDPERTVVRRNAISPPFRDLFSPGENVLAAKHAPPSLAYTSTPFRGLDILAHSFPAIRAQAPGVLLKVYSSMGVYQTPPDADAAKYGELYLQCRETAGIEYSGSIPQRELAAALRAVGILAYPNHFPETSCIAVLEAMAAGCWVLSTELGALPETTAGFGTLLPPGDNWLDYSERYIDEAVKLIERFREDRTAVDEQLRRQVAHVNQHYTWPQRAAEWEDWLTNL